MEAEESTVEGGAGKGCWAECLSNAARRQRGAVALEPDQLTVA